MKHTGWIFFILAYFTKYILFGKKFVQSVDKINLSYKISD